MRNILAIFTLFDGMAALVGAVILFRMRTSNNHWPAFAKAGAAFYSVYAFCAGLLFWARFRYAQELIACVQIQSPDYLTYVAYGTGMRAFGVIVSVVVLVLLMVNGRFIAFCGRTGMRVKKLLRLR